MMEFVARHAEKIDGVLSCFDRMLFRGYLPIMCGAAMYDFLIQKQIQLSCLKTFLTEHAAKVKTTPPLWQRSTDVPTFT